MNERDGYPEGVTCWVDAALPDPEAATEFYGSLFGWEFEDQMPADAPGHYFAARLRGRDVAALGSKPDDFPGPSAWNTYVWVESADEAAAAVKEAGGSVLMGPFDVLEAGRMAAVADPHGAVINLWEARRHRGAQLVNDFGAWTFSGLSTTDPEGAIAFYRSAFGWEADWAEDDWTFFRVPGYGDYLERAEPGLRKLLAERNAPPGFEDATAWLMSMAGQPEGTPPHWSVTFGVEDVDATAARAVEVGGKVLVEPFDAPPLRMAVLSDPQGLAFTVSKYDPDLAQSESD